MQPKTHGSLLSRYDQQVLCTCALLALPELSPGTLHPTTRNFTPIPCLLQVVRQRVAERVAELRAAAEATEALRRRSLTDLNNEAAAAAKAGDAVAAAATYALLFERAERLRLTHPELHLCYCNAAGVHLQLGLNEEAVQLAEKCRRVAEAALKR